jgi:membrane protease YdiL (CAAX protease family)
VLIAPVAEELVFRGLGFASLGRFALPLSTALFAVAHGLPVLLIPVGIAGLALGLLRQRSGSVLPGMGVHMTLNALALGIALLVS